MAYKAKETKLVLASLEIAVEKLNHFEEFINHLPPTIKNKTTLGELELRTKQTKPIMAKYEEALIEAKALSISDDEIMSLATFQKTYYRLMSTAYNITRHCNSSM